MERDQEARFERFVADSSTRLLRTAYLLVGDLGHAEDLLQTALERTARRWGSVRDTPEAYARRVLTNAATDRWRRRQARVDEIFQELPERPSGDIADAVSLHRSLVVALQQLPARQRAVLVLRYFDDLSEQAIADTLNMRIGTVKSTTSRALARLRELHPDLEMETAP